MKNGKNGRRRRWAVGLLLLLWPAWATAHAVPAGMEPRPASVLRAAPAEVRIWFEGEIEPAFSTIAVTDGAGRRVDRGDAQVDRQDRRVLRVSLPVLAPGVYTVRWRVLAVDGHRTKGEYTFTLKAVE